MKIRKAIVKSALVVTVALGALVGTASAAQKIHADYENMNPQQAKRAASQLRQMADHHPLGDLTALQPHIVHPDAASTRELFKARASGNLAPYITHARTVIKAALDSYIDGLGVAGAANFIDGAVAHATPAVGVAVVGTAAGANEPTDRTRDRFKAALHAAIDAATEAELEAYDGNRGRVAVPVDLKTRTLYSVEEGVKNATALAVDAYITALLAGGGGAAFLDGAVHVLPGAPVAVAGVGNIARPANNTQAAFAAALADVIDATDF